MASADVVGQTANAHRSPEDFPLEALPSRRRKCIDFAAARAMLHNDFQSDRHAAEWREVGSGRAQFWNDAGRPSHLDEGQ